LQPILRQVRDAFDALPSELFGNEQDKVAHQECLTVEGAFREIVSVLSRGEDISYLMPTFAMRHHRFAAAMRQWIASVQYRSAKAPGTSGEPGEQVRVVKKATTSSARKSMLSRHLRDARIRRGLSVAEVAAQAGVSVASIYLWETGRTHPRDANLSVLCKVLKLPIRAVKAIVDG
jgi:DNA-binding transcriptional regulator YiaG